MRDNLRAMPMSGTTVVSFDEVVAVFDDGLRNAFFANRLLSNASVASRGLPVTRGNVLAMLVSGTSDVAFDEFVASSTSRLCAESSSRSRRG